MGRYSVIWWVGIRRPQSLLDFPSIYSEVGIWRGSIFTIARSKKSALVSGFSFLVPFSLHTAFHHLIKIFGERLAGFVGHVFSHLFGPAGHRLRIV